MKKKTKTIMIPTKGITGLEAKALGILLRKYVPEELRKIRRIASIGDTIEDINGNRGDVVVITHAVRESGTSTTIRLCAGPKCWEIPSTSVRRIILAAGETPSEE
jgi:hypothetical protein